MPRVRRTFIRRRRRLHNKRRIPLPRLRKPEANLPPRAGHNSRPGLHPAQEPLENHRHNNFATNLNKNNNIKNGMLKNEK